MFSLICVWISDWVNNREAGDLRRHRGHYEVNVMFTFSMNNFPGFSHIWYDSGTPIVWDQVKWWPYVTFTNFNQFCRSHVSYWYRSMVLIASLYDLIRFWPCCCCNIVCNCVTTRPDLFLTCLCNTKLYGPSMIVSPIWTQMISNSKLSRDSELIW